MLIEIRPGEGGDDAALFADQLATSFGAWCRRRGIAHRTTTAASRTITVAVDGHQPTLAGFSGTHRVQREPRNGKGKRHTSTATVAVLDESAAPTVVLDDRDVTVEQFRSGGNGGQNAQKNSTAVRITHIPSGIVVSCQDERSYRRNLDLARAELVRRLTNQAGAVAADAQNQRRRSQIADGGRPVKAFTWNDQRNVVVDHSGGRSWPMTQLLRGKLA